MFQLFSINDPAFIKPLEAIAGGKLFNIVVDNENTSKLLLKRQCFGGANVIFIPNNKIVPNPLSDDVIERAKKIADSLGGEAAPAYSLIKYDPELQNTMEYVFGGTVSFSLNLVIPLRLSAATPKLPRRSPSIPRSVRSVSTLKEISSTPLVL